MCTLSAESLYPRPLHAVEEGEPAYSNCLWDMASFIAGTLVGTDTYVYNYQTFAGACVYVSLEPRLSVLDFVSQLWRNPEQKA